ncbi:hypothetical protein MBRA1_000230 [Malassezia brasiliensis]|uniref:Uncharacterized protein n=1 Tax=Malassezia brasiliensis TaxID=1821822 RepID=A0AAF0DTA4_9BASI|nr:hypothetical protein MBRA1_000230 [Malassezia brasiliensis]
MAGRRSGTPWDVAALRWSTLFGLDVPPGQAHVSGVRSLYGVRNIPVELGTSVDLGLDETRLPAEAPSEGEGATLGMSKRSQPTDLAFQAMVLRQDTLPQDAPGTVHMSETAGRRRRQRLVDGAVERASPYWKPSRRRGALRGPMQSRIPLVGRELDRLVAYSQRTSSLRTDRGTTRRVMALQARQEAEPGTEPGAVMVDAPTPGRSAPSASDTPGPLLPSVFAWTQHDEETWNQYAHGWPFLDERDARIPDASLLQSLHYFVAKYYETQGQLSPYPQPADAVACRALRAAPAPALVMDVGDDVWRFWAAHSLGYARSMLHAFDASAMVALGALVEEYTRLGAMGPRPATEDAAEASAVPAHGAPRDEDARDKSPPPSTLSSRSALRTALAYEPHSARQPRKVPPGLLERLASL